MMGLRNIDAALCRLLDNRARQRVLRAELGRRVPGDEVRLEVVDADGRTRTVELELAEGTP